MIAHPDLVAESTRLLECLARTGTRVVFAESCTAGLVSAALAAQPGVSAFHCGSAVVYRLDTKARWLGVDSDALIEPGPVSEVVARQMAEGVLERTPEATVALSITGHLGPDAPPELDGVVHVAAAFRAPRTPAFDEGRAVRHTLSCTDRPARQIEAAAFVLARGAEWIDALEG